MTTDHNNAISAIAAASDPSCRMQSNACSIAVVGGNKAAVEKAHEILSGLQGPALMAAQAAGVVGAAMAVGGLAIDPTNVGLAAIAGAIGGAFSGSSTSKPNSRA